MADRTPNPAEQSLQSQSNPSSQADKVDDASTAEKHSKVQDGNGLNLLAIGAEAAWHSGVREPLRGLTQAANLLPGVNLPVLEAQELTKTTTTLGWLSQTVGSGLGMVLPFKALSKVRPLVFGAELSGTSRAVADGMFFGALATPSDDPNKSLATQRAIAAIGGGVAFGTQHGLAGLGMSRLGLTEVNSLALKGITGRLGINAFSGGIAGAASAESNALLGERRLATYDELKDSAASFMVTGFALDALHVGKQLRDARRENVSAPAAPLVPAEARLVGSVGAPDQLSMPFMHEPDFNLRVADMQPRKPLTENIQPFAKRMVPPDEVAAIKQSTQGLHDAVAEVLRPLSVGDAMAHARDFRKLTDEVNNRAIVVEPGQIKQTLDAVRDLLQRDVQVVLGPGQKIGLAKQLLAEVAEPRLVAQGPNITCGPLCIQQIALLTTPGKQTRAVVDAITRGNFTVDLGEGKTSVVDVSKATFQRIDEANNLTKVFSRTLEPDHHALATLDVAARPGADLVLPNVRSYASQLSQIVNANIKWQALVPEADRAVYGRAARNPLIGDSGERRVYLNGERAMQIATRDNGEPHVGPGLESRDIQPIYDALTGKDSSHNNFVLLNTKEPITPQQGTRFLSPRELEMSLTTGNRHFIVEIDSDTPAFRIGSPRDGDPRRHVVLVEPNVDPVTAEMFMKGDHPIFNVSDGYGRTRGFHGANGLTARELYDASLHPNDPRAIESATRLPGIRNFGKIDENVLRGSRPESPQSLRELKKQGVTLVIDLIDNPVREGKHNREEVWAKRAGINYLHIKTGVKDLDLKHIQKIVEAIENELNPTDGRRPGKVFIHCARGADRTGTIDAYWNITHNNWSGREALAKMREYNWSENMHYAKRMGSMIEQTAQRFLPENPGENREVGMASKTPFQRASGLERIVELEASKDAILKAIGDGRSNELGVYREVERMLNVTGLSDAGWRIYPTTPKRSALDRAGADILMVRLDRGAQGSSESQTGSFRHGRDGDVHFLDFSANKAKGEYDSDTGRVDKPVPHIRRAGVIHFEPAFFEFGRFDVSNPEALVWRDDLRAQVLDLAGREAYFNLHHDPIPDFQPQQPRTMATELDTFVNWMEQNNGPRSEDYHEYAKMLKEGALKFTRDEAGSFQSDAFVNNVKRVSEDALITWLVTKYGPNRGAKIAAPINSESNVELRTDRLTHTRDFVLTTADQRVARASVADVMEGARLNLMRQLFINGRDLEKLDLREQRRVQALQKKLINGGLSVEMARNLLIREQSTIRAGGSAQHGDPEIAHDIQRVLKSRPEDQLLADSTAEKKTGAAAAGKEDAEAKPNGTPRKRALSKAELSLHDVGLDANSPHADVVIGLELIAENMAVGWPADEAKALRNLITDYANEDKQSVEQVRAMMQRAFAPRS